MKEKVNDALKQHFRPEFLNRIDETIVFHELTQGRGHPDRRPDDQAGLRQLEGQGLGLELTQEAKDFLADKGYDPTLGARPLRRAIQRLVEDPLSERLLWKEFRAGEIVVVDAERRRDRARSIVFRTVEGFEPPPVELAEAGSELTRRGPGASDGVPGRPEAALVAHGARRRHRGSPRAPRPRYRVRRCVRRRRARPGALCAACDVARGRRDRGRATASGTVDGGGRLDEEALAGPEPRRRARRRDDLAGRRAGTVTAAGRRRPTAADVDPGHASRSHARPGRRRAGRGHRRRRGAPRPRRRPRPLAFARPRATFAARLDLSGGLEEFSDAGLAAALVGEPLGVGRRRARGPAGPALADAVTFDLPGGAARRDRRRPRAMRTDSALGGRAVADAGRRRRLTLEASSTARDADRARAWPWLRRGRRRAGAAARRAAGPAAVHRPADRPTGAAGPAGRRPAAWVPVAVTPRP